MEVIVGKSNRYLTKSVNKKIRDMARKVELIIVIGEKKKSNINKIYEMSLKETGNAMIVETIEDLYINYIRRFKTIGILQDPTIPQNQLEIIVDMLKHTQVEGYIYEHFK